MSRKKERTAAREKASTRQLLNILSITDYSLVTSHGELVFFMFKPTNISVLSDSNVGARIYALMTVIKGMAELEMLCVNSRENFEDNKRFLKMRLEEEENPAIRKLLQQDTSHLDRIQMLMATAREFCFIIRLSGKESDVHGYLSRIETTIRDQRFTVRRADRFELKRLIGVYYEQNVTTERHEDYDGERWVILGE
jgi:hypothetical protein